MSMIEWKEMPGGPENKPKWGDKIENCITATSFWKPQRVRLVGKY